MIENHMDENHRLHDNIKSCILLKIQNAKLAPNQPKFCLPHPVLSCKITVQTAQTGRNQPALATLKHTSDDFQYAGTPSHMTLLNYSTRSVLYLNADYVNSGIFELLYLKL